MKSHAKSSVKRNENRIHVIPQSIFKIFADNKSSINGIIYHQHYLFLCALHLSFPWSLPEKQRWKPFHTVTLSDKIFPFLLTAESGKLLWLCGSGRGLVSVDEHINLLLLRFFLLRCSNLMEVTNAPHNQGRPEKEFFIIFLLSQCKHKREN